MLIFRLLPLTAMLLLTNEEVLNFYKAHNMTETLHFVKPHHLITAF